MLREKIVPLLECPRCDGRAWKREEVCTVNIETGNPASFSTQYQCVRCGFYMTKKDILDKYEDLEAEPSDGKLRRDYVSL